MAETKEEKKIEKEPEITPPVTDKPAEKEKSDFMSESLPKTDKGEALKAPVKEEEKPKTKKFKEVIKPEEEEAEELEPNIPSQGGQATQGSEPEKSNGNKWVDIADTISSDFTSEQKG